MKLSWRITLLFISMLITTSLLLTYIFHNEVMKDHESDHIQWSSALGNALSKAIMSDTLEGKKTEVGNTLRRITKDNPDIAYVVVVGFDGKIFSSTLDGDLPHELAHIEGGNCRVGSSTKWFLNQHEIRDISYPIVTNLDAHIHLGLDEETFSRSVTQATLKTAIAALIILLLALPIAVFIARRISRPVKQLTEEVSAFGRGEPFDISHVTGGDIEVRLLLNSFERMARERRHFELQIQQANDELEKRVQQRTAELQEAKDEADRANEVKSDFLSSMSHELRTPMNAILGFGQLLEMDDTLPDTHKDNIHEILKAGHHLLQLINEVLDLAKIESGHIDLSIEQVAVCKVVEECISLVKPLAEKRGVKISHTGLTGTAVRADRTRLKQVMINLLSNAIKYNRENGSVTIDICSAGKDRLHLRVIDTGPGIPAERLDELFLPFNRLTAANSEIEGTGIGLTIARRITEMMGGSLEVESTPGTGSMFWIELPREKMTLSERNSDDTQDLNEPADTTNVKASQHLVLYIEDNPSNLKLVAQIMGRHKHINLITAHTPELGIEFALARTPDLILLDINMPGLNGFQVLEFFKNKDGMKEIPVVAITAKAMAKDIKRGMAAGFNDYLTKPLNVAKFDEVLNRHLSKKSS